MKYTTNNSMRFVNNKITLQTGSPDHPEINQRVICQKELYYVDPVPEINIQIFTCIWLYDNECIYIAYTVYQGVEGGTADYGEEREGNLVGD